MWSAGNWPLPAQRQCFAGRRELLDQRRGLPESRIGVRVRREFVHPPHDAIEAECVGVEHRAAAIARKTISREVDDVEIGGTQRDTFLDDARTFVHQREHAPVDDLVVLDLARLEADLPPVPRNQFADRNFAALESRKLAPGTRLPAPEILFPRYVEAGAGAPAPS